MDRIQAPAAAKSLTLAFEKAVQKEASVSHPWRYFVAAGETLQKIEEFLADVNRADQARADMCARVGAKSFNGVYGFTFENLTYADLLPLEGTERTDFHMQGGAGTEPWQSKRVAHLPGFVVADGRAFGQVHPDVATDFGRALRDECMAIEQMANPALRFANWLGAANVDIPLDGNANGSKTKVSATVQKIGNDWIVAVPVEVKYSYADQSTTQQWIVPPGAAPITISDYFARVEKAQLIRNTGPAA